MCGYEASKPIVHWNVCWVLGEETSSLTWAAQTDAAVLRNTIYSFFYDQIVSINYVSNNSYKHICLITASCPSKTKQNKKKGRKKSVQINDFRAHILFSWLNLILIRSTSCFPAAVISLFCVFFVKLLITLNKLL